MSGAQVKEQAISSLRPYARNARTHSKKQVKQIAASIEWFGFTNPVLISDDGEIVAGHGRVEAAKLLKWKTVPTIALSHLSETERRAYVLADNKLALNAGWDKEMLAIALQALVDLDFEVELTGFSLAKSTSCSTRPAKPIPTAAMLSMTQSRSPPVPRSRARATSGCWDATACSAGMRGPRLTSRH